ncbi:MAG TPA: phosphate acyltransferase PlsX, partial [bacterium]|nr:phosphate acyltransferase PlsX [bacterium]
MVVKIAVDAMGGDNAPAAPVKGAQMAAADDTLHITLAGVEKQIEEFLLPEFKGRFTLCHRESFVNMADKVSLSLLRDRETTMARILSLVKERIADAALSAGNTAAFVTLAISHLGLLPGIERPAIAVLLPTTSGCYTVTLDVGANTAVKPVHLLQYGMMGSGYARVMLDVERPTVGLLNVGEEPTKGDELRRETFRLFQKHQGLVNFVGNVEGQDIFQGKVNVLVCDGFTGNIILKASEGLFRSFRSILRRELSRNFIGRLGGFMLRSHFREFARRCDYADYGGGILLGVNGLVIIS